MINWIYLLKTVRVLMVYFISTIGLLILSNVFMTYAWFGHLKDFSKSPLWMVILLSWLIAGLEYIFLIPATRIGFFQAHLNLTQLKILQELITLAVFIPFSFYYMGHPLTLNYLYAGLCLMGAVYFIFK
jgi:uncharacterized protein (DUF486 family)